MDAKYIRNFSIIAHIDHGKSTLADGLMDLTSALRERDKKSQFLDQMDIERERGITIKAQTVCLHYQYQGRGYQLNLIDTPGHVDFSYEVSRSLSACEGALLVVDASQGAQAQTLAHAQSAKKSGLKLIPILNKVDLPSADIEQTAQQLKDLMGFSREEILSISAKKKEGLAEVLSAVIERIPPPASRSTEPLQALVFDSWFDSYQGVAALCRMKSGTVKTGDLVLFMNAGVQCEILKMGIFSPYVELKKELSSGEVAFIITGLKDIRKIKVGDTLTHQKYPAQNPLEGFKKLKPMVYCGVYPVDSVDFNHLKKSLEKLSLNDSSLVYEKESSPALGLGFRCGFLGLLHLEIVQERLEREFNLNLIMTSPSVVHRVQLRSGGFIEIENPSEFPDFSQIECIEEPYVRLFIYLTQDCLGAVFKLCEVKRGKQIKMEYLSKSKVMVEYEMPLAEVAADFHDRLKSASKGYASMEYEWAGWQREDLRKIDILIDGDKVSAFSFIAHKDQVERRGRGVVKKLKELIPRQQYPISLQAAIGSRVLARETISAFRKDVTAKLYGGDVTRKRKLLEKQKKGKKRMKQLGKAQIPQEAFLSILKMDDS